MREKRHTPALTEPLEADLKDANYLAIPLLALGVGLTLLSFYWLRSETAQPQPDLSRPRFSVEDWVPSLPQTSEAEVGESARADGAPAISEAPIAWIRASSVEIEAPVETVGLDQTGAMQDPPDPVSVVWYDFSARPGFLGNTVLAGHVDYYNYGPAVFWRLRELKPGDQIEVGLEDGSVFAYEVETLDYYDVDSAPVSEIVGPTSYEAMTLITCGGSFDADAAEYNQRLIVRAKRIPVAAVTP